MSVIRTLDGKCKRCYTCVRHCPVKAISVEGGMAKVLDDFCVACGTCVRYCNQKAKEVSSDLAEVSGLLEKGERKMVALLAPSFPASFPDLAPQQVVAALKHAGFERVIEVAFGAELVGREAKRLLTNAKMPKPILTSPCPVVVSLIEKHFPHLIPHLAPTVSPLIATGRYLRVHGYPEAVLIFIGPCIAKKQEIRDPAVAGIINLALTFRETKALLAARGIHPTELEGIPMDPPHPGEGRVFPLMGGILKTAGLGTDILDRRIAIVEGEQETMEFLASFAHTPPKQEIVDILFCRGCINGVEIDSDLSHLEKQHKILELVSESRHLNPSSLPQINLDRTFTDRKRRLPRPTDDQITDILRSFGKFTPEDELNCGACGYKSCRDKALAVFHGFAEPEMCLPQIIKQLEDSCQDLKVSHDELKKAQDELVHSEKLASLGQLSAGVAHELNNPLGGILLFSNILLEKIQKDASGAVPEELEVVVKEATRCRNIVRGLLDFARQSKLQRTSVNMRELIQEILKIELRSAPEAIRLTTSFDGAFPVCQVDPVQIRQAFTNLIHNAVEAMPKGGEITVTTRFLPDSLEGEIIIGDTGIGIPEENLPKLFTPFYTTKGIGKGTGLGLAITYGIIKMHRGSISVQSTPGQGTKFRILLPTETDLGELPVGFHGKF